MNKRIRKKLHKHFLTLYVIDLSYESRLWRSRLFEAPMNQDFPLDGKHLEDVPKRLTQSIKRYRLEYDIAKVAPEEAKEWHYDDGMIIFRFRAREFKAIVEYTANNPDVL